LPYNPRVLDPKIDSNETPESEPWFGDGLSFSCTQCGNCCTGPSGFVWFDDDEAQAMADHLAMDLRSFYQQYARRAMGRWTLQEVKRDNRYDCVFLKETEEGRRVCSIYSVRPTQCRTWPFWKINMRDRQGWEMSASSCPGMRKPDERGENFVPIEQIRVIMAKNPKHL